MTKNTETKRDGILRKVQLLLDKAESTTHEPEAEALRAKAMDLIAAYQLEAWEVEKRKGKGVKSKPGRREVGIVDKDSPFKARLIDLHSAVCRYVGVKPIYREWTSPISAINVGFEDDLEFAEFLFNSLRLQMTSHLEPKPDPTLTPLENATVLRGSGLKWHRVLVLLGFRETETEVKGYKSAEAKFIKEWRSYVKEMGKEDELMHFNHANYRSNYVTGYVTTVQRRLAEAKKRQEESMSSDEGTSFALVVRDKADDVRSAFDEMFPPEARGRLSVRDGNSKFNGAAHARGRTAGERADLGQSRVAPRKTLPSS